MKWAVNAYQKWRDYRLSDVGYDEKIFEANLDEIRNLSIDNMSYALCRFIPEVKKAKSNEDYPSKTLYEIVVSIQKYLNHNKIPWKLIHGDEFEEVRNVLDNTMQNRTKSGVGNVKKQAEFISYEYENKLWELNVLWENSPSQLRDTVLFLLGINYAFRAGDEHYNLQRTHNGRPSQFTFEKNSKGQEMLVFREDTVTKTYSGGLTL